MSGQFTKANAGSNDTVLEFHEFLTMLVRISFFRANPQYGMRKGKDQKNADQFGDEVPLPGCLSEMLTEKVLVNARTETYAKEFKENTFELPEVKAALGEHLDGLSTFFEMTSAGKPTLELDQWIRALEGKLLFSNLKIDGYAVRLTEPQARAAWISACADPAVGCTPDELGACVPARDAALGGRQGQRLPGDAAGRGRRGGRGALRDRRPQGQRRRRVSGPQGQRADPLPSSAASLPLD